jgi:hypothetical protein
LPINLKTSQGYIVTVRPVLIAQPSDDQRSERAARI